MDSNYSGHHASSTSLSDGIILASSRPKKSAGRKKFRETRHPVYRGVRQRNSGKWVCELRHPNNVKSRIWLGTFPTADMAARAHDVATIALRGPTLCLNFADSTWRLPVPASDDPKDIRRAAVEAAEAFRPPPTDQQQGTSNAFSATAVTGSTQTGGCGCGVDDEEDMFRMPEVVADMYKGMMLSPPEPAFDDMAYDDVESDFDVPLWSYTF